MRQTKPQCEAIDIAGEVVQRCEESASGIWKTHRLCDAHNPNRRRTFRSFMTRWPLREQEEEQTERMKS